jgi:hypothetical protein
MWGFLVDKVAMTLTSVRVLRFPLPIVIPPNAPFIKHGLYAEEFTA